MMVVSQVYTVATQVFFAATNLLYASGRSCRYANALCLLLHRYSGWPACLGSSKLQLQCTGGWNASCSCTFLFILIFAISHDSLIPLMRHCLPDASPPCTNHSALCSSSALKACILAKQAPACSILQVRVQCAIAPFLVLAVRSLMPLASSIRFSLPAACLMLKAGTRYHPLGSVALICRCCSVEVAQPVASSSRQLWSRRPLITACRKSPMRLCLCLSLERFLSLVIGGFSPWNFSKTPEAALVFAKL